MNGDIRRQNFTFGPNSNVTREELAKKYGEENADYLLAEFAGFTRHYQRLAYIDTPVAESARWRRAAEQIARDRGWRFERLPGDLGWLQQMLNADWDEQHFLKLNPGQRAGFRSDELLIDAEDP